MSLIIRKDPKMYVAAQFGNGINGDESVDLLLYCLISGGSSEGDGCRQREE